LDTIGEKIDTIDQLLARGNIWFGYFPAGQCALAMKVNCQRDPEDNFLKMVRAALDRFESNQSHRAFIERLRKSFAMLYSITHDPDGYSNSVFSETLHLISD
jgi:hypothetical protein